MASNIIRSLQHSFLKELPGLEAQLRMAPPGRGQMPPVPKSVRQSAVCSLLYFKNKALHTLLIKRTDDGKTHGGQISFPGGRLDANDFSLTYCALRECEEEIGLAKSQIKILGRLTELFIPPSNFLVSPILCYVEHIENLIPSPNEVAEIIEVPILELFDNANKKMHEIRRGNAGELIMKTPIYNFREHIIWGATAMMLAEFEEIYRRVQ